MKTSTKKNEELKDEVAESIESETLNLLVKRFGKYLKRKGVKGNPKRYTSKHNDSNSSNFTCYNCGKQGHIKIECPNANKEKEKRTYQKIKFNVSSPRLETITMQLPNQYQTMMPIHVSC